MACTPQGVFSGSTFSQKDWRDGKKKCVAEPNPSQMPNQILPTTYFSDFFVLRTVNMRCKNQEKEYLRIPCENLLSEKKYLTSTKFFRGPDILILFDGNILMRLFKMGMRKPLKTVGTSGWNLVTTTLNSNMPKGHSMPYWSTFLASSENFLVKLPFSC